MIYIRQFLIVLVIYFLGNVLQEVLNLPIPGAVLGMIILFAVLYSGLIKADTVEELGEFLLSNMSLLFIPAGVGLITSLDLLSGKWFVFITIIVISTTIVFVVTAFTVKLLRRVL